MGDDPHFTTAVINSTVTEQVDTLYKTIATDTAFVRIPVLQRKVMGKTTEDQAQEVANEIFDLRKKRIAAITGDTDYHFPDGTAMREILAAFDKQEEQLLSLFIGAKVETRYIHTYSAVPDHPGVSTPLFYFSDKKGIVAKNTPGAKSVWYKTGETDVPDQSKLASSNVVYYRIPQVVEVSAGVGKNLVAANQTTIYQFGRIVAFPLLAPKQ
jgi:hypothetical protein